MEQVSAISSIEHMRLLLIEDEPSVAREIAVELNSLGYFVSIASTEAAGLEAARSNAADLLIVDRMLSGTDSLSMIRMLRSEGIRVPVLMISALASVDERIRGLKAGGDDYLIKPFAMDELAARVEVLLRRTGDTRSTNLRVGPLEIDLIERTARRGKRVLDLLPSEFKLLEYLMRHPGATLTRGMILEHVWDMNADPFTNTVDVHIRYLRQKIDDDHGLKLIKTVHGCGYKIEGGKLL